MVIQRSSLVEGHATVESKRSGLVARVLFASGLTVAALGVGAPAQASHVGSHRDQGVVQATADHTAHGSYGYGPAVVSGPKSNPDKKAEAKAAREKKKAERAARREEKLAKAKAKKAERGEHGDKVAKADKPINDDMGGSDDPLEGL